MLDNILKSKGVQKMNSKELKATIAGKAPLCCIKWNPVLRYCYEWDQACLGN